MSDRDRETLEQWASELECNLPSTTESVRYAQAWTRLNALRSLLERLNYYETPHPCPICTPIHEENERLLGEQQRADTLSTLLDQEKTRIGKAALETLIALLQNDYITHGELRAVMRRAVKALKGKAE